MPPWNETLKEINQQKSLAGNALDTVRHKYLLRLHKHTNRNVISYYSAFLTKPAIQSGIVNDDLNGFMMAVHSLDRTKGLDLIVHTPGGEVAATESIIHYLRQMFDKDIRAIVPHAAMSGGTMIACSCKEIILGKHSQLGPTDPHLNGIPAAGVVEEFARAVKEIQANPGCLPVWQTIIGKYHPTFLSRCENAINRSSDFVSKQLETVMFSGETNAKKTAKNIVQALNDYRGNKGHDRPIHVTECQEIGLKVNPLELDPKLQDLVLTVHHCYMHAFQQTGAFKIIENHKGVATVKHTIPPVMA